MYLLRTLVVPLIFQSIYLVRCSGHDWQYEEGRHGNYRHVYSRRQIDPGLAELYKNWKKGSGLLIAPPNLSDKEINVIANIYKHSDCHDCYIGPNNAHLKAYEKKGGSGKGIDPALAELYKNWKKGDGLLAAPTDITKKDVKTIANIYSKYPGHDLKVQQGGKLKGISPELADLYKHWKHGDGLLAPPPGIKEKDIYTIANIYKKYSPGDKDLIVNKKDIKLYGKGKKKRKGKKKKKSYYY